MEDEMKKFQEEQEKLIREREKRKEQEAKLKAKEEAKEQELKEQKPKDGITVLKEVGLKNVSNKTFINLENLTNLLNKDFEKLHKTKALGFIQILEREFKVDLHELREDYLSYTNGSRRINEKKSIPAKVSQTSTKKRVRDSKTIIQESNKSSFKIGPYLLLLLAGVAGYFLLKSGTSDEDKITATDLNISQSKVVKDEPKNSLLAQAVEEESNQTKNEAVDEDDDLNKIVQKMLKNSQDLESNQSSQNSTVQQTMQEESNLSTTQEQIVSSNNRELEDASKVQSTDLESIEKSVDEVNLSNRAKESEEKVSAKVKEETSVVKKESEKVVANIPNNLYLVPKQRAWVGVIYLDDYTKKDYLIRGKLKLDPNRDQLILVGHNKIKIYKDSKQFKVHSKKKARFIYENGELREISKQEYKERSAGVRW